MTKTVQLFITCIVDALYPEIGEATVRVLEKAGVSVEFPMDQTCCGQPAFNAGERLEARKMAEHTIAVFEAAPGDVVVPSGSCAAMIRHSYLELFAEDEKMLARAKKLAARTYELSEYLVDVLGAADLGAWFPGKITYHASCHLLRELGVHRQPLALLSKVRDAELVELPEAKECCGFGGVFSVEHPRISAEMLGRKLDSLKACGAPVLVACDAGCLTHINGGLKRRGRSERGFHIAEILDSDGE